MLEHLNIHTDNLSPASQTPTKYIYLQQSIVKFYFILSSRMKLLFVETGYAIFSFHNWTNIGCV